MLVPAEALQHFGQDQAPDDDGAPAERIVQRVRLHPQRAQSGERLVQRRVHAIAERRYAVGLTVASIR